MEEEKTSRRLCPDAVAMLVCLGVQVGVILCVTVFVRLVPDQFMGLQNLTMMATTAVGVGCAVGSVRQRGWINRGVGIAGLLWFGFLVAHAAVTILSRA